MEGQNISQWCFNKALPRPLLTRQCEYKEGQLTLRLTKSRPLSNLVQCSYVSLLSCMFCLSYHPIYELSLILSTPPLNFFIYTTILFSQSFHHLFRFGNIYLLFDFLAFFYLFTVYSVIHSFISFFLFANAFSVFPVNIVFISFHNSSTPFLLLSSSSNILNLFLSSSLNPSSS